MSQATSPASTAERNPRRLTLGPFVHARNQHRLILFFSAFVVFCAMTMNIQNKARVTIPGTDILVPEMCMMKVMAGIPCAGCGLTRSFIALGHGDWQASWQYHPAGMFLFSLIALQIPYRLVQLWRIRTNRSELSWGKGMIVALVVVACLIYARWMAALVAYWL